MLKSKQDIALYFYDQVITPYTQFIKCRNSPEIGGGRDLRTALNAAVAIYHFREQLADTFSPSYENVAQCPDYALTRDVADIAKHRELDRRSAQLRGADGIQEMLVTTIYKDGLGEYCNSVKEFKLHLINGASRDLSEVLTNSINFWCRYLAEQKVTPTFPKFSMPNAVGPLPRAKCQSNANISIIKGLKFGGAIIQLQRYNDSTGQVEPMDLTGYKPIARAFVPRHEFVIGLRNDSTGEEFRETISLNPNQSNEFDALTSDEERQNYLSKLPEVVSLCARLASKVAAFCNTNTTNEDRQNS